MKGQQERILAAGKPAIEQICREAARDAHEYAFRTSKAKRDEAKSWVQNAQKTLSQVEGLASEFPEIAIAKEVVSVSLDQPSLSNGKISLASSLIERGKSTAILESISPSPGVVTGIFARDRIGQLLTSTKLAPETAEWAVKYLGDCIRRADGEKRATAISILVQESAAVPLARQRAMEEAASITTHLSHKGQKQISKSIHSFSRRASLNTPEKTLFMDLAKELRKSDSIDAKLFPITIEERQQAGRAFKKDTTVIMSAFHTAVEAEERAARGGHPLSELLDEFDEPAAPKPAAAPADPIAKPELAAPAGAPTLGMAPRPILPVPTEPEPAFAAPLAPAPEQLPEPQLSGAETLRKMFEEGPEVGYLPDKTMLTAMRTISSSKTKQRAAAYKRLCAYYAEAIGSDYSTTDMINDLSAHLSIPATDEEAISAGRVFAEALLSLPQVAKWGAVEAQEIRSILATANPEYVNYAILSKLKGGNEAEKGEALLVLVERAEINIMRKIQTL